MNRLRLLLLSLWVAFTLLLCATVSAADLTLAWDDTQKNVTYNVWKELAGAWRQVNRKPILERQYVVNAQEGTHRYAVTAHDGEQDSERSNTLAVRVDVTVLDSE